VTEKIPRDFIARKLLAILVKARKRNEFASKISLQAAWKDLSTVPAESDVHDAK
jgi:hypothetical protein